MSATVTHNRIDMMEEMSEDESVIFHNYTKKKCDKNNNAILFLEGEDDIEYYNNIFCRFLGEHKKDWVEMVCYGRSNVIELIDVLKNHTRPEYRNGIYFGFIDKDYHEVQSNPHPDKIYITPVYSIENFYTSTEFFKKILERKFYVLEGSSNDEDFKSCLENFINRRDEFIRGIIELDCLLRCNRLMYEERLIRQKIYARGIKLYHNVSIDINKVVFLKSALDILKLEDNSFDASCLENSKAFYANKNDEELSKNIRGKFMMYFMHHYLHKLKEDNFKRQPTLFTKSLRDSKINGPKKISFKRTKMTFTKEKEDLISDLAIFADTPSCLTDFVKKINIIKAKNDTLDS